MLLLEPVLDNLRWTVDGGGGRPAQGTLELAGSAGDALEALSALDGRGGFGYVLPHGGDAVQEPVSLLDEEGLGAIEAALAYAPEANRRILAAARAGLERFPDQRHVLLCETAFFRDLPPAAAVYGLPYELLVRGVRRYGGDGLCHQWVWSRLGEGDGAQRLVSVHLDDAPNAAAILDGRAVETSLGFTPVEGVPAADRSGDLDAEIVLLLRGQGYSAEALERLLRRESGWQALVGQRVGFEALLRGVTPPFIAARELVEARLVKAIGAGMAALGGADWLAFVSRDPLAVMGSIERLCRRLEFAGATFRAAPLQSGDFWELSLAGAALRVVALRYDRHHALEALAQGV